MRLLCVLLIVLSALLMGMLGCKKEHELTCKTVSEEVDNRNASELFHRDSSRVFTFEMYFNDSVSIAVGSRVAATGRLVSDFTNGMARSFLIKAQPREIIMIQTTSDCAYFPLKDGYKYLYFNRNKGKWKVTYSNVGRGYF
ncbi:hypothetical protein [Siphonobacter curvatus]|uniref:Lipoprotein n=1 Tax=Siphonobacter curvatus TaxID=2094562 RepID=A0A2S7IHB7_9BACT|nr:hypothetical protein [Siphonobacter curvatus]PQA54949.1 hypothetical protein C5O19_20590 [Siphonobacter curvatus]